MTNARSIWLICIIAAFGGLLFGYDWVVIGGAKPFYERFFRLTGQNEIGWANSCALLGCLGGSLVSGLLADRIGRKKVLIACALLFAVSSVLTGWAPAFGWFIVWRIAGGGAIGMASGVSPIYIAEVSPAEWRGRMVSLNQLTIVIGILMAQIANWLIARPVPANATAEFIRESWNGQYGWRWMFTAVAVPSLVFLAGACFIPESPRWLARAKEVDAPSVSWRALLTPRLRKVLGIGIFLAVLQQWSGINVIFNYAEEIYRGAGYDVNGILFNIVITGAINLLCTLIAFGVVDRLGRRALMLVGCAGIALSHTLLGFAYHLKLTGLPVLVLTLITIGWYAMSLAPVTWVLIAEMFPNRERGLAVSVAVSALWIACFLLTFTFPLLNSALGPAATFWIYAAICATGFVFILTRVPETRGKTLEEIEGSWSAEG